MKLSQKQERYQQAVQTSVCMYMYTVKVCTTIHSGGRDAGELLYRACSTRARGKKQQDQQEQQQEQYECRVEWHQRAQLIQKDKAIEAARSE